jgi:hypothetical protein
MENRTARRWDIVCATDKHQPCFPGHSVLQQLNREQSRLGRLRANGRDGYALQAHWAERTRACRGVRLPEVSAAPSRATHLLSGHE